MKAKLFLKDSWSILKDTVNELIKDRVMNMSAALAYYTVFSLPPMLIVLIGLGSVFFGREAVQGEIFSRIQEYVGPTAAGQIEDVLEKTATQHDNILATVIGFLTLLLAATGIFGEIQTSINVIWGIKAKPKKAFMKMLMNRLLSFSMVVVMGFILLVSLILNAVIEALLDGLKANFPDNIVNYLYILNYIVIFIITSTLFAFIFKFLPDAKLKWKDVRISAFVTTLLFMIGKVLIGLYLAKNKTVSAYGAAGSLVVVLVWVYYSSIILYFGAEFTQVYMRYRGRKIEPNKYAVLEEKEKREVPPD
jgi:membrane protein